MSPMGRVDAGVDAVVALVGAGHAREAGAADGVAGVRPRVVVSPGDEDEVAEVLRAATAHGLAVTVCGTASRMSWGAPPERCDVVLSTRRLDALVEHEPGDLVCVAGAGIPLTRLQERLAAADGHDQRLMLDPPGGGSLGGVVAAGASGPVRTRYGTARDLVIGARFVLADGTVGHSGGKVVKNVAGYDVAKVLIGSLGTLAVITQLSLRLHPMPPASRTVVAATGSPADVQRLADCVQALPVVLSVFDVAWPDGEALLRVDGSEDGARAQADLLAGVSGGRVLSAEEGTGVARRLHDRPWAGPGAIAAVAVPRSRLAELLDLAGAHAEEIIVRAAVGTAEARLADDATVVAAFRTGVERLGGHLVLRRAVAAAAVTWPQSDGPAHDLMRALKGALDPGRVLSPGRFIGGI